ncbi:DUF6932 family protein [Iningainema tapete]|uniref:Uncharacterized protein n=1 Tax=Iningainema tapete BLCC-T55 TaxID=2748662 RepID=A0A8J6XP68_9CYAN|nr:hypothetical protein [Iningainema tapete]MBD2775570.1 hypothetical protein [Iningainema tapete BLCC-T55]
MIPEFDENGNLPPGVHFCDWDEFKEKFGYTPRRAQMILGMSAAMSQLKAAGCRIFYINGSFVTSEPKPNDFDACWEPDDVDMDYLRKNAPTLLNFSNKRAAQKAKYKGELFRSDQPVDDEGTTSIDFFQLDRRQNKKGIIAIDLLRWSYD